MCLGLPGLIVSVEDDNRAGQVDVAGVLREIDLSMLTGPVYPGEYVLVHSGIALERMTASRAREAQDLIPPTGGTAAV